MLALIANTVGEIDVVAIIGTVGGLVVALAVIVGGFVYRWRAKALEADLKYEMIQKGMSADEIERVLAARLGPKGDR